MNFYRHYRIVPQDAVSPCLCGFRAIHARRLGKAQSLTDAKSPYNFPYSH
jgi:hypothetical protein